MRWRPLLPLVIAWSLGAAPVQLTPEQPLLRDPAVGPSPILQVPDGVASNGGNFLALWGGGTTLQLTPVSLEGRTAAAASRIAAYASRGLLASDGHDYLLVASSPYWGPVSAQRFDEQGNALAAPRQIWAYGNPDGLVWNQGAYLLAGSGRATLLDRDGAVLRELDLGLKDVLWTGVQDGSFVVLDRSTDGGTSSYAIHRIDRSGRETGVTRAGLPWTSGTPVLVVAASASRMLVADPSTRSFVVIDGNGSPVTARTPACAATAAAWDAQRFLITCGEGQGMSAMRVAWDGSVIDPIPFPLSASGANPRWASGGGRQVLLWSEAKNVVARTVSDFDELATEPAEPSLVSYTGRVQEDVRIAYGGDSLLAIWRSGGDIEASRDGRAFHVASGVLPYPAYGDLGSGDRNFLVVWIPEADAAPLKARRIGYDGSLLDSEPIDVAPIEWITSPLHPPRVIWTGSTFVVARPDQTKLRVARVSTDGSVLEKRDLAAFGVPEDARPFSVGENLWIATTHWTSIHCPPRGGCPYLTFGLARTDRNAADVVGGVNNPLSFGPAIAAGPHALLFLWSAGSSFSGENLFTMQLSFDGRKSAPRKGPAVAAEQAELRWNGNEYVAVWKGRGAGFMAPSPLWGMRLNANGEPLDDAPFLIVPDGVANVALANTPAGVAIAYTRWDGGVPRAFVRTLAPLPLWPRREAVRH